MAAAITFNTALPVGKKEFVNRELFVLKRSGKDPSGLQRDVKADAPVSVLGYGITSNLALFAKLPYLDKDLSLRMNGQSISRSTAKFGDLIVFGRYTFFQKNGRGHTFRITGFAGTNDPNSGGTTLFLSPGLQYVTQRWIIEAVLQKPMIQNLNGSALENDYVLRTGFRWNF